MTSSASFQLPFQCRAYERTGIESETCAAGLLAYSYAISRRLMPSYRSQMAVSIILAESERLWVCAPIPLSKPDIGLLQPHLDAGPTFGLAQNVPPGHLLYGRARKCAHREGTVVLPRSPSYDGQNLAKLLRRYYRSD